MKELNEEDFQEYDSYIKVVKFGEKPTTSDNKQKAPEVKTRREY